MTFSRLMLGTVQFGLPYGIANVRGMPDDDDVAAILKEAFDAGMNAIDTSADYGTSEERLGNAMTRLGLTGRFDVVTKIPKVPDGLSDREIASFIEEHLTRSLRRLRIEHLAGALFHFESDAVYLPLLKTMVDRGYIAIEGVSLNSSNHPNEVANAGCVQIPSNIFDHRFDFLVESAKERRRHVFARSAFLQGSLLMPAENLPACLGPLIPYRKSLENIAEESGFSLKQLAVGYLISQPGITSIVVGVETTEQVRENLLLMTTAMLPGDLLERLKNLVGLLPEELIQPSLWTNPR